jgi:hypothetical protein
MDFENEDAALDSEVNSTDATSGTQTFGFSSSRGAANPYTGQLQELLTKYLANSEKAATDKQALLDKARERVMARSAGPDKAEMAFRVAAALGKPTRTGSFGESLGNVAETTGDILSQRRKANQELEDLNLKYQLASADAKGEGQKTQISALSALARSVPKDRLTEIEKLQEVIDDPKAKEGAKKNAQARITYLTTRPSTVKTNELEQLLEKINDPSVPAASKAVYRQRLNKLNYIPSEAKAERDSDKPQSPAGKIAKDEGLVPGTPEYQARVKALTGEGKGMNLSAAEQKELFEAEDIVKAGESVILNLSKAKELSPKAYEGFGAGARRSIVRNIPGAGSSEGVTATTELETLVGENSLSQLKAIFGGAPTEGERKILLDLQGSISMSDAERQKIYERALKAAARRVKSNQEKMERIRKGSYSRVTPEANADGGFVGRYADGGLVAHYLQGGEVSTADLRAQIEAGPRTQAALDQALTTYSPAQLAAAFPEYGGVADYNNAAREAYARLEQQRQTDNREAVRADMAAKGEEFRIANPGGDVNSESLAYPTMSAIPQAELDAARAKLTPDQQNFVDWRIRQINPMTHQLIANEFARQGSNPYLDAATAQEQIDRVGRRSDMFAQAGVTPEVNLAPWQDPNWREKQDAAEKAEAARQAQLQADWEKIPVNQRPVVGGGIVSPSATGGSSVNPGGSSFVSGPRAQPDIEYLANKYIGGPQDVTKYGQSGSSSAGEHSFFERTPTRMADGGMVKMADGGEMSFANIGRAVGQGLGLGFGDEAIARVRSKMEGRPYEDVVREEREAYEKFQNRYPFAALGTELASGIIPTLGMAMVPGAGTPGAIAGGTRMAQAANRLRQSLPGFMTGSMGRAAGAGATTGAVAGAGSATEGNRTGGALSGGATGAVLGPTVAKGIQLGGQGVSAVKNAIRPSPGTVEQRATNKVLEAMGRDEMDPTALRDRMLADKKLGVQSSVMDASPSLSSLGEAVVTRPGPGRKILGTGLNERLEGGREAAASRALKDIGKGVDYVAQEDTLMGKLRANANNLYDTAYAHGSVDDPRIMKVLEDDTFKKAFKEAQAIAAKEARAAELRGEDASRFKLKDLYELDPSDNTFKFTGTQLPDVRTLDYVKRGIDALIDKGYRGEGMSKAEANALKDLKRAYVSVIDENVPEYAAARAKYAGDMEVLDALRLGRTDYLSPKMLPNEAKKLVNDMSEAERDALRAGVAQSLLTKVMDAPQQINAAQRIIGAPATRKRLEALFQDPNEYKVFEAALQRESELFRNAQDIVRGSRTANKTAAMADLKAGNGIFDVAGEAVDIATGSPGSVVGRVLKYLQARTSLDEQTAGEVAKMLKSGSMKEVDATLKRLESSSAKFLEDKNVSARRMKTTSGTVGAAAPTTRLPPPESDEMPEEDDEAKLQRLLEKYSTEE